MELTISAVIKIIIGVIIIIIVAGGASSLWGYISPLAKTEYKELPASQKSGIESSFNGFIQRTEDCLAKKNDKLCICRDLMIRLPVDIKKGAKINITQNIKNSEIQLLYNNKPTGLKKTVEFVHFSYMASGDSMPKTKELAVTGSIIDLNKNEITVHYISQSGISKESAEIIASHAIKVPQSTSFISFAAKAGIGSPDYFSVDKQLQEIEKLPEC